MVEFTLISSLPFVLALLIVWPPVRALLGRGGQTLLLTSAIALMLVVYLGYFPYVANDQVLKLDLPWVEALGLHFTLYIDGLALLFGTIVVGIGVAVTLYTGFYFDDDQETGRFYTLLMAFTGSMLLLVFAGNVLTLFIAWELTSVISFLLISFKGAKSEAARVGAMRALIITGGGGLALIAGLLILSAAAGSTQFETILNTDLRSHPWYMGFTVLILLGCFTKSAQFPFHFWLPGGMTAPSPASAFLHSATMVKAGVYLLLRLEPTLGGSALWINALIGIGLITMLIGALFALQKRDLKALLAYSTISQLGALVALIGMPESAGIKAAVIGVLAHALYKAALFLMAGIVEHSTGTRNLDKLGGLRPLMPGAAVITALACLSMAGFPPMLGFVGKETLLDAAQPEGLLTTVPLIVMIISSILTVAVSARFAWDLFFAPAKADHHEHFHRPPLGLIISTGALAFMSLIGGVLLGPLIVPLIDAAVQKEFTLYLFPPEGLASPVFQTSLAVLALGGGIFAIRRWWLTWPDLPIPTGNQAYEWVIGAVNTCGDLLLRTQNGKLRHYLITILAGLALFIILLNFALGNLVQLRNLNFAFFNPPIDALRIVLILLAIITGLGAIILKKHLMAAISLSIMGYSVGGIFLLEPAPDVALVQILVETLATVLIIIMIARLSAKQREAILSVRFNHRYSVIRDVVIAASIGTVVGLFALIAVENRPVSSSINRPIALHYLQNTYRDLKITDTVGGIVTDYRGTDTVLEITVFAMAALGLLTLLTRPESRELIYGKAVQDIDQDFKKQVRLAEQAEREYEKELGVAQNERAESRMSTPLTRKIAALVLPFALLISAAHVLYSGVAPGDGFTAGVVAGLAVALWYVVYGYFEARERLNWLVPGRVVVLGLVLTLANAIMPEVFGGQFLEHITLSETWSPAGLHFASTLFFEIGIFLTVFGGSSIIMEAIAHPRELEERDIE
ncbi:MAG: DUF4040 domain-containing protein [Anaerolineae bacterium]|nr:DUF4040 domain-containing protein [Anaerolineae bacterium]